MHFETGLQKWLETIHHVAPHSFKQHRCRGRRAHCCTEDWEAWLPSTLLFSSCQNWSWSSREPQLNCSEAFLSEAGVGGRGGGWNLAGIRTNPRESLGSFISLGRKALILNLGLWEPLGDTKLLWPPTWQAWRAWGSHRNCNGKETSWLARIILNQRLSNYILPALASVAQLLRGSSRKPKGRKFGCVCER